MYQILPLCMKHGSYMFRATLRNFVGNIPTPLNLVRKIPTHDILCRNNSYTYYSYICKNNSYTCRIYSYTARRCLTLCAICRNRSYKIQQGGIFPTKFCKNSQFCIFPQFSILNSYTCRNHASYTSVKFLLALYPKLMISYLIWNMLKHI